MNDSELETLLLDLESDHVERKESLSDREKIRETVCAFANDLPGEGRIGVLFVGARDDGRPSGLAITDELLLNLADIRDSGLIQPFPDMVVEKRVLHGAQIGVVLVRPAMAPPVRYKGRVCVRVGPRRGIATEAEEKRLAERRRGADLPFELRAFPGASLRDIDIDLFLRTYLPAAVDPTVIEENHRSIEDQLVSLRFLTPEGLPTAVGLLVIGVKPAHHIPGAHVQFLRIDGTDLGDSIHSEKRIDGPLIDQLRQLDEVLGLNIGAPVDIASQPIEVRHPDYPMVALQQLARNAILHRTYEWTRAPVRIHWFTDRVEILSPGGPYGQVTAENFGRPGITDYRNVYLAEAMKVLGYVQKFGVGIATARAALSRNGNPPAEFEVQTENILVRLRRRP